MGKGSTDRIQKEIERKNNFRRELEREEMEASWG